MNRTGHFLFHALILHISFTKSNDLTSGWSAPGKVNRPDPLTRGVGHEIDQSLSIAHQRTDNSTSRATYACTPSSSRLDHVHPRPGFPEFTLQTPTSDNVSATQHFGAWIRAGDKSCPEQLPVHFQVGLIGKVIALPMPQPAPEARPVRHADVGLPHLHFGTLLLGVTLRRPSAPPRNRPGAPPAPVLGARPTRLCFGGFFIP